MAEIDDSLLSKEETNAAFQYIFYFKLAEKHFTEFLNKPYLEGIILKKAIMEDKNFNNIMMWQKKPKPAISL